MGTNPHKKNASKALIRGRRSLAVDYLQTVVVHTFRSEAGIELTTSCVVGGLSSACSFARICVEINVIQLRQSTNYVLMYKI